MRAAAWVLPLALASCGRVGFDSVPATDAGTDAGPSDPCSWVDAPPTFGPPERIDEPSQIGTYESDPVLSADGLTLYFASNRGGDLDVYASTRTDADATFGAPTLVSEAQSSSEETRYARSPDDLEAFVSTNRPGGLGDADIWVATRATPAASFGAFVPMPRVASTLGDYDPFISADGDSLYLAPLFRFAGVDSQEILVARRAGASANFMPPTHIPSLTSPQSDADPSLTADELVIVLASERAGGPTRFVYATRPTRTAPFAPPVEIPNLPPETVQLHDPFISPDGCDLYFAADVDTRAEFDLYVLRAVR